MKDGTKEGQPAAVPAGATQAGEVRARWAWAEPTVWTERMLTALETGVKGGKWFSLIDKVYALPNLRAAFAEVKANKGAAGIDHQSVEMFEKDLEANLGRLSEELRSGSYQPRAVRRRWIEKAGKKNEKRPLGIPTVRDRVVQAAVVHVLEPIFERQFADHSYGFRPGRGCKDALRRVNELLETGHRFVVDADLKSYFDTIPHSALMDRVRAKVADGRVLSLIEAFLRQEVMEEMKHWTPEAGTPQGAVLSPLLSNIYLDPLDHAMAEQGFEMVRYADDFVILCRDEAQAQRALREVGEWTAQAGLTLHPEKTKVVNAAEPGGFDFLGYHFERGYRWPRKKSEQKFKDTIRSKTKRTNGKSLEMIIATLNPTIRGWFQYFQHSHWNTFPGLDGWVRARLRAILKKRRKGRGRAVTRMAHQRWPNAFFAEHGLFSMTTAHARLCQSSRR